MASHRYPILCEPVARPRQLAGTMLGATFGLVAVGLPSAVRAQEEPTPVTLPPVEVFADAPSEVAHGPVDGYVATRSATATKTDTPLIETPQSISVITRDQMEAQNVTDLGEALRYTPGIQGETFGFEPRTTFLRIRGFDATETALYR